MRSLVQNEISEKIDNIMAEYVDEYFQPAIEKVKKNLGEDSVNAEYLLEMVCVNALEHAKATLATSSDDVVPSAGQRQVCTGNVQQ